MTDTLHKSLGIPDDSVQFVKAFQRRILAGERLCVYCGSGRITTHNPVLLQNVQKYRGCTMQQYFCNKCKCFFYVITAPGTDKKVEIWGPVTHYSKTTPDTFHGNTGE